MRYFRKQVDKIMIIKLNLVALMLLSSLVYAEDNPLPKPLSLEFTLQRAAQSHPKVAHAQSRYAQAQARLKAAKTQHSLDIDLYGRVTWGQPSKTNPYLGHQDHRARLTIRRRLYDFGQKKARVEAANQYLEAEKTAVLVTHWQQKLTAAQAFFNVLLADLQAQVGTEALAIAFIDFDRMQDRQRVGQRADIDIARAENVYQAVLQDSQKSDLQQRVSRSTLAHILNAPTDLPSELKIPRLVDNQRVLPEVEILIQQVLQYNPQRQILAQELQAAGAEIRAERAERLPIIHGQLEANYWQRRLSSRDNTRAMLEIEVPLYTGGYRNSQIALAKATVYERQAELANLELDLRQTVLEIWADLRNLAMQREVDKSRLRWRDMEMDKHRTLYDLEFATDFGQGLVELSRSSLRSAETEYAIAMQWLHLRALSNDHLPEIKGAAK
jgi:outer membrane protein TolC